MKVLELLGSKQWVQISAGAITALTGFGVARLLPIVPSTVMSAVLLSGGARMTNRLTRPSHWWAVIGLGCGSFLGTAVAVSKSLISPVTSPSTLEPGQTVLILAIAGAITGHTLGKKAAWNKGRHPRDLLRAASGLTTGIFAAVVTLTYVSAGLEAARALSSRLSTALTILIFALAAPGWLIHLVSQSNQQSNEP